MEKKTLVTHICFYQFEELSLEYQQLISIAKEQTEKSYSPYSNFAVGAAVLMHNGEIFAGSNQENAAYPSGLCAERTAMFYANAQRPDIPIRAIAIAAYAHNDFLEDPVAPCGACRQALLENEGRFEQPLQILLYGKKGIYVVDSVKDLLPLCFTKESLQ
ncbi:MAG: cytidine deaminase [Bacteroidetes bacterium]|nr:cytidine deaminase [Bacteroidota bacterium]